MLSALAAAARTEFMTYLSALYIAGVIAADRRDRDRHESVFFAHSTSDPERTRRTFRSSASP
jgi:hypothetical protein